MVQTAVITRMLFHLALKDETMSLVVSAQPMVAGVAVQPHELKASFAGLGNTPIDNVVSDALSARVPGNHHACQV